MSDQPSRTLCCWPGLAGLWLCGHWSSLFVAVGFSLLLNLALVSTFVWPALLSPELKLLVWSVIVICWLLFGWISWQYLDQYEKGHETPDKTDDTLFIQAQTEYLKGDFTQAELLLVQQLQVDSRDAEARLLLVAIYRRSGRETKALQQLEVLQRLDTSIRWQFEIERERQLIDQDEPDEALQDEDSSDTRNDGTITLGEAFIDRSPENAYEAFHEDKPDSPGTTHSVSTNSTFHRRAA